MIEFQSEIFPFSGPESCGDFAIRVKREDGDLLAVGDVAGHGDPVVGRLAQSCMSRLSKSANLSLEEIINDLEELPGMSDRGVSIFLGLFDRALPLLHYYLLGDISVQHFTDGRYKRLPNHDAPLGLLARVSDRKFRSIKVAPGELFTLTSDGVKLSFETESNTPATTTLDRLFEQFVSSMSHGADDGVIALARVPGTVQNNSRSTVIHNIPSPRKNATETAQISRNTSAMEKLKFETPDFTTVLGPGASIGQLQSKDQIRPYLRLLFELVQLGDFERAKLESFLLQQAEETDSSAELFSEDNLLQIQFGYSVEIEQQAKALFSPERVQHKDSTLIVSLPCAYKRTITDEDRKRLLQRLSAKDYEDQQTRQKNESLLAEQSKLAAMGEMVGAIAHQWRQPLNELGLRIQRLQLHQHHSRLETNEVDAFAQESLELIQHMANTIDDFREFFSHDSQGSSFEVRSVIDEVLRLHSAQLENNGIAVAISGDSFRAVGQASHLKQIFFNLISNARDALRAHEIKNPRISVTLDAATSELRFADNAGGVPTDTLERIFEPYYTTKTHGQGTGMGLYMCRMLAVEHLHGSIYATNIGGASSGLEIRLSLLSKPND